VQYFGVNDAVAASPFRILLMLKTSVRYFMSVVQHGSIRAAAAELNVAQSAISRQIQALEHEIGAPLLERRSRGVALTAAGELLHSYGRDATFQVERLTSELDALHGLRRGHVRIASIEALVPHLLPQAISRFLNQYPGVAFSVEVGGTDRIIGTVREGRADIGLAFNPQPSGDLRVILRVREPLFAMVTPSHPLSRSQQTSVGQIAAWPVAVPVRYTGSRMLFDEACREAHVVIAPALESNSVELLHRFALLGNGVAVLARLSAIESLRTRKLRAIRFKEENLASGTIDVITLAGRRLPVAAEKFLIALRGAIDALPMPH
jgi:DNA-binding transcriptional LysR family regulator